MTGTTKNDGTRSVGARTLGAPWFLVLAAIGVGGCATGGLLEYQPLAQTSSVSVAVRWQALQALADKEGWIVVADDRNQGTLEALLPATGTEGIRDRIKIALLPKQTVVGVHSEIQSAGAWYATPFRCANYGYFREAHLTDRLDGEASVELVVQPRPRSLALAQ